jgi:hypothetical protein
MSNINFTCPHCQKEMSFPSTVVGQQGKCSGCQQIITIQPNLPPPMPKTDTKKKKIIFAAVATSAVGIVFLCLISILLIFWFSGGSGKADFDATGKEIFNALRERSTAKLQSHMCNNVVVSNIEAKIREDVPESLQTAYDEKMGADFFSEGDMAKLSSLFIGFYSNIEAQHPELKSQWKNIEYIGITGFLPRKSGADGQERFIDEFKLDFEYSGSYDPDVVVDLGIWFRLDDEIYVFTSIEAMIEFDGKLYGFGDDGARVRKATKGGRWSQKPMYGGSEKVRAQLMQELGASFED